MRSGIRPHPQQVEAGLLQGHERIRRGRQLVDVLGDHGEVEQDLAPGRIAHHALHPGHHRQPLALRDFLDPVQVVSRIDHCVAGAELDPLGSGCGVDDEFAALVALRVVEEDRDRAVDPERVRPAHDDVVHVVAVAHAGLIAAHDRRHDPARAHDHLDLLVLPQPPENHTYDGVALGLAQRQLLVDLAVGNQEAGRAHAVGELAPGGGLLHGGNLVGRENLADHLEHGATPVWRPVLIPSAVNRNRSTALPSIACLREAEASLRQRQAGRPRSLSPT